MLEEFIKIRDDFFNNLEQESKEFVDDLYFLSMPKEFDVDNFFPQVFNLPDYNPEILQYKKPRLRKLVDFAIETKKNIIKDPKNKTDLILVHPFYAFLRHINLCNKETKDYQAELLNYKKNMDKIIKNNDFNIHLIDTPDSFIIASELWKKYPPVDVIFTYHSKGNFLHKDKIRTKENLICGSYIGHCIDDVIKENIKDPYFLVKEIVISRPKDFKNIDVNNYPTISINDL